MLHVFTIASDLEKTDMLKISAEWSKLKIIIIPWKHWNNFTDKIYAMKQILDFIPDEDIVCFIDAYDVLCMSSEQEILEKFFAYNSEIVLSSEVNCYPIENYHDYESITNGTEYKYVNSGGYIGYTYALRRMFEWKTNQEIESICFLGGDQQFFTKYYLHHYDDNEMMPHNSCNFFKNGHVCLDEFQRIFQSLYKVPLRHFVFLEGRLYNHSLKTYPCFVHFNGFHDYRREIIHNETGERVPAMQQFIENMTKSRKWGSAAMEHHLPDMNL
jgi:hypothetical protein